MDEREWLAQRFEEHRTRLRAVGYRMLGSVSEADDAVQEAWLRLSRSDVSTIENLGAWLTTVVGRVSLDMLRSRRRQREEPLGVHVPEPLVDRADSVDPAHEALLADSVGLALLVVLETLTPAERLAFVLHDMFAVPFDQIAPIVNRSHDAVRQLASRARRRVHGEHAISDADLDTQRRVVDAFLAAARDGDFDALVAVLDPTVVLRADLGPAGRSREVRGATAVAGLASAYSQLGLVLRPALVNGTVGIVAVRDGKPFSVGGLAVSGGMIVSIDILADPERLDDLDLTILDDRGAKGQLQSPTLRRSAMLQKLSERSEDLPDDPFGGRQPTSHERMTGLSWDASYHNGPAPWDIGRPQPAVVRLAAEGGFAGAVLDAGCGTGENALHVSALGLPVLGLDVAETALAIARGKSDDRGLEVEFVAADAFELERLGRRFDTVLDCGLFHSLDGDERQRYAASLASVTVHGGTLYVLCFSDDGPDTGPHPVSQEELRAAFNPGVGWEIAALAADRLQTRFHDDGAPAWLVTIKRI